jgi:hypothetical protein
MDKTSHPLNWRFSDDLVGFSKQQTRNLLKILASRKTMLYTCSITWAFGKKSGSSFHFPPTSETGSAISWRKTKIIGENLNTRLETVAITGVQKSASVHPLHKSGSETIRSPLFCPNPLKMRHLIPLRTTHINSQKRIQT